MTSIEIFKNYYQEVKDKIDNALEKYNQELADDNHLIQKNLEYFQDLNSGGKDIRGVLIVLGYDCMKNEKDYSIPLALAYEIFQTAILVHDDIIDEDDKRRGKETIHKRIFDESKDRHFSNSVALCMGDYGLFSANKVISDSYEKNPNLGKIMSYYHSIVLKTIKGEILDVILPKEKESLEKNILEIYRYKTAYYTIIGPLWLGLLLGEVDSSFEQEITEFGENIGIAFQIQDDILGIFSKEMGKEKSTDIKENKQTLLYSSIMNTPYKEEFISLYGKDLESDKIERVKELFIISGAKKYAEDKMNEYYKKALEILDNMNWIKEEKKEILKGFIEYLKLRNK